MGCLQRRMRRVKFTSVVDIETHNSHGRYMSARQAQAEVERGGGGVAVWRCHLALQGFLGYGVTHFLGLPLGQP